MLSKRVKGIVRLEDELFYFPVKEGYGLVSTQIGDILLRFNCIIEKTPPEGYGEVVSISTLNIRLILGQIMFYMSGTLHIIYLPIDKRECEFY